MFPCRTSQVLKMMRLFISLGIFKEEQPTFDLCIESNSTIKVVQQIQVEEAEMN